MGRNNKIKRWVMAASILFIFLFQLRAGALAIEDAKWRDVLNYFQDTFRLAGESLHDFSSRLDTQSREFAKEMAAIEKSKGQLMLMYGGSYDPDDLRVLVKGLSALRAEAENRFKWFAEAEHGVENTANKIAELKAELRSQSAEPSAAEFIEALNRNITDISNLESQLQLIRSTMEESREAFGSFISRLDEAEQSTRRKTATYWKIHYLKSMPGLFSESTFKDFKTGLQRWMAEGALWWDMIGSPGEMLRIRELLLKISASILILALAGSIILRKLGSSLLSQTNLAGLFPIWILICIWGSITWFGESAPFSVSALVLTAGEEALSLVLIYVFVFFQKRSCGTGKNSFIAVFALWVLHILSLEIRALNFSYGMALAAWIFSLAACSLYMYWKKRGGTDLRQRGPYLATTYLLSILIIIAASGYLPLSFLILSTIMYGWLSANLCINLLRSLSEFGKGAGGQDRVLVDIMFTLGLPVVVLAFGYLNLWLLSFHLGGPEVLNRLLSAGLTWDTYRVNLKILSLIILGFYITRALAMLVEFLVLRAAHLEAGIIEVIQKTSKYLFWGLFTTGVLSLLGFSLMSLTVVAGGLSVGIGFGLQQIVNNFLSGLILLIGRSVQPGDTVQIGDTLGDVRRVTILNTVVQTRDNATLFVPNSELITNKLVNWSHRDKRVRLTIDVGVAYGSDTQKVRTLLFQAARSVPGVLSAPTPEVFFFNFGASTLDFQIRFWIGDMEQDSQFLSLVRYEIERLFRENEIEIAFPQSTIHIQTAAGLEKFLAK